MNKLYFSKVKKEAIIPSKRSEDAGYDLYACNNSGNIFISPGEIVVIPTGIAVAFDSDKVLIVKERSSTGVIGLSIRMGVIDSGYRGEISIGLNNTSNQEICLTSIFDKITKEDGRIYYPYTKALAQAILLYLPQVETEEVSYDKLLTFTSERMLSKLGDSGK